MKIMRAKDIDYGINTSVRVNSRLKYMDYSNVHIPYAVFCLEKADHSYSWG